MGPRFHPQQVLEPKDISEHKKQPYFFPIKIPARYFVDIDKIILKFIWKGKENRIAKIILKKKTKARGLSIRGFKTHCIRTVIKAVVLAQR